METEDEITDTETVDSQDVKENVWGGNVDMLLNSSDCEQINPEDEEEVNKIIKEEIKELEFKCRCCTFVATSFEDIEKHENGHRARGTFLECEYCEFCTNTRDIMIQHVTKHTGERPFKCKKCPFRSRWKRDLIKHQVKHSDEKKFMCSQCDFTTKWYNNIKHHQIKHSTERPFSCHICDMKFKRKTGLDYHLYRHNDYKPKKCSICDFRCKTNFELKLHQHKHSNVRNFPCTFPGCTQRCKTKSDLSKHIKIHSNVRDKICDICNKGFATFANLSKHKLRHVTERKFQCELCTRRFKTRISLRNHLTTHNDHKPFSCDVCGHRFRNRHNMKTHKLTHSEDRAFKCPICPYAGKFPFHIFAHIGTFHGDKYAYFCEICRKPFRRYSQLQTHCGRMHKDSNLLTAVPEIKQEVVDEGQEQSSSEKTKGNIPTDTVANGTDSPQATNTQSDDQSAISSKTEEGNTPTGTAANETDSPQATNTQIDDQSASNSNVADDNVPSTQSKTHAIGENVNLLVPKSEDPNVLIYNIGPFRLPLATIGFDFNFEKTGKKPKQWFMDPQNMTDQTAAEKQRAYIEKKARGVDKSRGATLRKFDWKKPPYKPSLEENPRYKRERERQKREKEAGRSLVKQDPDLMELINLGRTNIRKVKICKRAGLLMKNWKVLEVKLEKIDAIDQKEIRQETKHGTEQTEAADLLETGSIKSTALKISSGSSTKRKKPTESIAHQTSGGKHKMRKLTIKDMTEIHSDSQEESNSIDLAEVISEDISATVSQIGKGFKSKSYQSKKAKRPVGRPRKHPKKSFIPKSKKIKSAIDLLPPLPKLGQISTTNVPPDDLLNLPAKSSSPGIKETTLEPHHSADLKDNSTVENITNTDKTQTSIDNPMDHQDEVSKTKENNLSNQQTDKPSGSKEYSRTILSVPKIPRRLPTDMGSIDVASTSSSSSKKPSQNRSGRLNQTIDKLLAKKTSDMKTPKLWQPFISTEDASTTESGSHATDGKRHRKSDAPRKIQKKGGCKRDLLDFTSSDDDDLPLSMISGKQPEQMSYEDFITELQTRNESEQQTPKRKVGRPRKTEVQNSPKKILENLLCQPFRTKRNLTDLDVLRYMDESISSRDPVVSTTTVNAPVLYASATTSKIECELSESSINRRHQRRPITLPSLYNKLTLKDALTMPNEFAPDLSFKTTDLVGPEPDRKLGLPEITSLQEKDDLLRIQKCLRHEKYRLKKLDPESVAIQHISQMINSGRAPKSEKGSTSDCPILKKVLLRTKEADDNPDDDDVIITGVKDVPKKSIKIIIKKHKIEDVSASTHTSEKIFKSRKTEQSVERDRKGKKKKGQVMHKAFQDSDTTSTHIKKDPSNSSISKEVKRIKRKYTKKSSLWEVQNSKKEQPISPPKKLKMKKNQTKSPGSSSKLSNIKKPRAKPLGKKCIASPDIKEVLQKYITNRRQLSLKTKKEKKKTKKVPKIKIKKTPKVSPKVKAKKTPKEKQVGKESKSKVKKNKTDLKKNKKGLKVKIMRKPKTTIHGPEIYVDIEDEDVEYMTNSLQEKIIAIPESMGAEFPKTEPMDEQDLYSGTGDQDTDFAQVSLESDCSEQPQSWQQETDTKLHLHIDRCRDSSDLDPSNDVKSTEEALSSIKIEDEERSMDVPIIKQEKPDYCDFSAQYEDISDFEPDIPVKEESLLQSENPQILNMVHVKYI